MLKFTGTDVPGPWDRSSLECKFHSLLLRSFRSQEQTDLGRNSSDTNRTLQNSASDKILPHFFNLSFSTSANSPTMSGTTKHCKGLHKGPPERPQRTTKDLRDTADDVTIQNQWYTAPTAFVGLGMSPYSVLVASRAVWCTKAHGKSYDADMFQDDSSRQWSNIQT